MNLCNFGRNWFGLHLTNDISLEADYNHYRAHYDAPIGIGMTDKQNATFMQISTSLLWLILIPT